MRDDDPITKFTLYQSYRQLKSGQIQRKSTDKTAQKLPDTSISQNVMTHISGPADFNNLDMLFEAVKRSISPDLERKDEPLNPYSNSINQEELFDNSSDRPLDGRVLKIVHKPFGFNINQFKNEFKHETFGDEKL
jgi:hypothetical protein